MQTIRSALLARGGPPTVVLAGATVLGVLLAGCAAASAAAPHPLARAGWHGRPINDPQPRVKASVLGRATYPAGWSAGAVGFGSGYRQPGGSRRVRQVQRRLKQLGYHVGPIDGLYGPLTRSAVQWFQLKHGLRATGVVAATTLLALRNPAAVAKRAARAAAPAPAPSHAPSTAATPQPAPERSAPQTSGGGNGNPVPPWLGLLLGTGLVAALVGLLAVRPVRRRRARYDRRVLIAPLVPAAGREDAFDEQPLVFGYVTAADDAPLSHHEETIKDACVHNGWNLVMLVRDSQPMSGKALERPGLAFALEQLKEGRATRLVVHRLEHLGRSLGELHSVLAWFRRTEISLTALDVGLDTGTPEGRSTAGILMSAGRSRHVKRFAPNAKGMDAARRITRAPDPQVLMPAGHPERARE